MIELGDEVQDVITGFTGIAIAKTEWLYGCNRYGVQSQALGTDGKAQEASWFDEPQLIILNKQKVKNPKLWVEEIKDPGGPRNDPIARKEIQSVINPIRR